MSAKYPDPKFFRFKDHINWKAQADNIKEIGGIVAELLKETDWKDVGKATAGDMKAFATLFHKGTFEVASTDVGGDAWVKDLTEVRGIARLGVSKFDTAAVVARKLALT